MYGYGASPLEVLACQAMIQGLIYMDQFWYSTSWIAGTPTALTANGDKTTQIQVNSDSDFIAQEYHLSAKRNATDQFVQLPPFLITITRSGSGRNLMTEPQLISNVCGNYGGYALDTNSNQYANYPSRLSITSLYQGNGTVSIRLQNPMAQDWAEVRFSMFGFKVFYQTNQQGVTGNRQDIFHAL
jgi:hypothetical protein